MLKHLQNNNLWGGLLLAKKRPNLKVWTPLKPNLAGSKENLPGKNLYQNQVWNTLSYKNGDKIKSEFRKIHCVSFPKQRFKF
jgi:hypothetical protein